jgi:DNA invertase Pin-like site-specific DNA recombinase
MPRGKKHQGLRGKRFIVYIRVSMVGDRGEDLISDDVQLAECRRWAGREDAAIIDVVIDLDETGRSFDKRKITKVLGRIKAGEVDGVLLWKISRFGRNLIDSLTNIRDMRKQGGLIASATENLEDIESAMGKFSLNQMLAIAELQSDMIGETWTNIHDYRRERGLPHTGGPRFGYDWHKGEKDPSKVYTPSEITGPWLARAYRHFVAGGRLVNVCEEMWENGVRSTSGRRLVYGSLLNTLDTGFGAGLIVHRQGGNHGNPSGWDFHPGAHEAVIPMDVWQAYLARRADARPPREKAAVHKFSALVHCASCHRKATTAWSRNKKHRVREMQCSLRYASRRTNLPCPAPFTLRLSSLDKHVLSWLLQHAEGEDALNTALARQRAAERARADMEGIGKEIARLSTRLSRAADMALDEDEPTARAAFRQRANEIGTEIKQLRTQREQLEQEASVSEIPAQTAFSALIAVWDRMDVAMLNEALRKVIKRIYIEPGKHTPGRVSIIGTWEELPDKPTLVAVD